jgi:hypothetical protein
MVMVVFPLPEEAAAIIIAIKPRTIPNFLESFSFDFLVLFFGDRLCL